MKPRWVLHGLVIATTLLLLAVIAMTVWGRRAPPLPVLGEVPEFSLVEASGQPLHRSDLTGRVWIASFIFTHCASSCPVMTHQLSEVQRLFPNSAALRLVSFTVDPDRDTGAVLQAYARQYGADRSRWLFVTGEKARLRRLARDGFHLTAEDAGPQDEEPILHSTHFVLVDRAGRIRGYYGGLEAPAVAQLVRDARALLKSPA